MTISMSMVPEKTIEECKRHVDECAALLERTSVPAARLSCYPLSRLDVNGMEGLLSALDIKADRIYHAVGAGQRLRD